MSETLDFRLLNEVQRDFPLSSAPYAILAQQFDVDEWQVLEALRRLQDEGAISRVGAVFSPRRIGASTLAALAVPVERLETVADEVSACPEVNHNYEREHEWNLWFVATAPDVAHLGRVLSGIAEQSACPLIRLPLKEEFHIDLGFDLKKGRLASQATASSPSFHPFPSAAGSLLPLSRWQPTPRERRLMAALQDGLTLEPHPYITLAARAGVTEVDALAYLQQWLEAGLIKRFGVVVRHHELGWTANAMCVWDVPDEAVSALGHKLAAMDGVTLCYRRERDLPAWPYNLYCMIHGRARDEVAGRLDEIRQSLALGDYPHQVLFSLRRYKQRGARYIDLGGGV